MSALGDYVHLTTANYLKYGVHRSIESNGYSYRSIQQNFLNDRIKAGLGKQASINKKTIETLKKRLSLNSDSENEKAKKRANKRLNNIIQEVYKVLAPMTTQSLFRSLNKDSAYGLELNSPIFNQFWKSAYTKPQIRKKIEDKKEILEEIKRLNKIGLVTEQDLINLQQKMINLNQNFEPGSLNDLENISNALTDIIYNNQVNTLKGDFGENLVAMVGDEAWKLAKTSTEEAMKIAKKAIVGAETSENILDIKDFVIQGVDLHKYGGATYFNKKEGDELGSTEYSLKTTKNKVDVMIKVNKQDIFASIKNYRFTKSSNVSLQTTVSPFLSLTVLQKYYEDFGNHWLNMHTATSSLMWAEANKEDSDKTMAQEFAYEALVSGNPLKQNVQHANIFIALDSSSGKVYVESTQEMLLHHFNDFIFDPPISTIRLFNQYQASIEERIARLLIDMHKAKVHVSFNTHIRES